MAWAIRYYGYYSNKARGQRKKEDREDKVAAIVNNDLSKKAFRKSWARLIQKIYNVDPLKCPYCSGKMRIISFVEDKETIKKILKHLNLWEIQNHDPPDARKIPVEFEYLISKNVICNSDKIDNDSSNLFPDYDSIDELPKYEEWY